MSRPEKSLVITRDNVRNAMLDAWELVNKGLHAGDVVLTLGRKKRSNDQNAKMWPMLSDISKHVQLRGSKYSPDQWKVILIKHWSETSGNNATLLPDYEGGGLFYTASSSKLNKGQFSELIEVLYQVGAENRVPWSEPALKAYEQYRVR